MKHVLAILVVLVMVAGISWAVDFGGSTAVGVTANAEVQKVEVDQEIDVDIGPLHLDLNGGLDYDSMIIESINVGHVSPDYEIGAKVGFSIFTVGGSITGDEAVSLKDVKAFLDIAVGDVGGDIDIKLSADPENEIFQGAEFSAFWNPGPLELRAGYFLTSSGVGEINVPEVFDDGGIYAKIKISY